MNRRASNQRGPRRVWQRKPVIAVAAVVLVGLAVAVVPVPSASPSGEGTLVGSYHWWWKKQSWERHGGYDKNAPPEDGQQAPGDGQAADGGHGDHGGVPVGPDPEEDFLDIRQAPQIGSSPLTQPRETFTVDCGRNENGLFNAENVIVAPGVEHAAQHMHDYVGNQDVNRFTPDVGLNNQILAQGETTCENGDQSMHYWPVVRDINGEGADAQESGGGLDGNIGSILTPARVSLEFRGNTTADVVEMPRFLQIITGNARAFTADGANANAHWTCTGFEGDRILRDRYPLCPEGSDVVRIFDFPSCWNGRDIESDDNRSHIVFEQGDGTCPEGFVPVPQLRQTLVYQVPDGPSFAVDGFPEQLRKPITDHSDFINVMSDELMSQVVDCVNTGRGC